MALPIKPVFNSKDTRNEPPRPKLTQDDTVSFYEDDTSLIILPADEVESDEEVTEVAPEVDEPSYYVEEDTLPLEDAENWIEPEEALGEESTLEEDPDLSDELSFETAPLVEEESVPSEETAVVEPEIVEPVVETPPAPPAGRLPTRPTPRPQLGNQTVAKAGSVSVAKRLKAYGDALEEEIGIEKLNPENLRSNKLERTEPVQKEPVIVTDRKNLNSSRYGGISAEHAVYGKYELYEHLDNQIHKMVNHIQETLSETGESEKIGMARRERGSDLYQEMMFKVDRLISRAISTVEGFGIDARDNSYFIAAVTNEILGFGPLEPLWQNPDISEVMVNGPFDIRVEIKGKTRIATGVKFRDREHTMQVANSFLTLSGRTFSTKMPYADGSLPDGSRLNAIHPEIAPDGPYLTIRRFPDTVFSLEKLVTLGSLDKDMACTLGNLVEFGISMVVGGGTGTGKALSIDTLIPTPAGLIRLGDLVVGDTVFGADGKPVNVTGYFPQPEGRNTYLVNFADGSSVVADAEHNWYANGAVRTTAEMLADIANTVYRIPLAAPVQYAEQELPVDPYLLGFWMACANDDAKISGENTNVEKVLKDRGLEFKRKFERVGGDSVLMLEVDGFADLLDALGLSDDLEASEAVTLPEAYLIASEGQRRALLAGFLDNGGILHRRTGDIELVVADNGRLTDQLVRLITSLGFAANRRSMVYNGSNMETLVFKSDVDVFLCEDLREKHEGCRSTVDKFKSIESIVPVASVDVACISVDSEDHLYLFGNEHTVTHNTSMLNALSGCIPDDERIITVEDTLELQLNPNKQVLRMRSRPANPKGEDAVTIRDLVRNTLRMRPDRIVVGEVRDASAYDMLNALNTGHDGSLTTTHASNPAGTIERLALLTSEAGEVTPDRALSLIAGAVDIIVNIERYQEDGSRRVSTVSEVPSQLDVKDGRLILTPVTLWEWVRDGVDANGKLYGHYEKRNEMSDSLVRDHALDKRKWKTIEQLFESSKVEQPNGDSGK